MRGSYIYWVKQCCRLNHQSCRIWNGISLKTSRGDTIRYSKVMDMSATAYTASLRTQERRRIILFGITAAGIKVKKGVIAADPRVIPLLPGFMLNTRRTGLWLCYRCRRRDQGNKIDLYYDSQNLWTGSRQKVKVYILSDN